MRPAGNENKGAMKLRVDFKQKKTGEFLFLFRNQTFILYVLFTCMCAYSFKVNELDLSPQMIPWRRRSAALPVENK